MGSAGYGRPWSFWWSNSLPNQPGQEQQWARVAEVWAKREGYDLEKGYVMVKIKLLPNEQWWEKDRHLKLEGLPWRDCAKLEWLDGKRRIRFQYGGAIREQTNNRALGHRKLQP